VFDVKYFAFKKESGIMFKSRRFYSLAVMVGVGLAIAPLTAMANPSIAVWLDGNTDATGGGSGIPTSLAQAFGAGSYELVTSAQLDDPGFLDQFGAVVVSRYGSNFGTNLDATAAANVSAYVGSGASEGGVAVFTNDAADNFQGATTGDPYDSNLNQLFVNSVTYALKSGHGYVGEFNGAVMALDANSAGFSALGLLQGSASPTAAYGPQFTYGVGPVGANNPIDAGVTFPFTDSDDTTFLTTVTGADQNNVVDVYTSAGINDVPAVLANEFVISGGGGGGTPVPEPGSLALLGTGLACVWLFRRKRNH
jgi:hypothetical protein